jgi:hypothetical protein
MEKDPTDSINIETNSKDFVFFLNSLGQMPVLDLLSQGLTVLKSKAEELKEKLVSISVPDN